MSDGHTYSTSDLCEISGCTYRQADYWCLIGLLKPAGGGRGQYRTFTDTELDVAIVLAHLTNAVSHGGRGVANLTTLANAVRKQQATFKLATGIEVDVAKILKRR